MNTPRLFRLLLVLVQGFPMLGQADTGVKSSIRYDAAAPTNPIVLSWPSIPGSAYFIKVAPVLGSPWQGLTPSPLLATTNISIWKDAADQRSRFYQVLRLEGNLTLQGQVSDALNGSPLAGATVMAGGLMALTDTNGIYTISNLSAGSLLADFTADVRSGKAPLTVRFQNLSTATPAVVTVAGSKPGYFSYTNAQVGLTAVETNRLDFSLSPAAVGKLRFVLNWGAKPKDLDAHLATPSIGGKVYEIYYGPGHRGDTNAPPYAQLDVDRTAGFGPETITIERFEPGTYRFYVHNYQEEQGNTGELKDSGAVVQVYSDQGLLQTINVPTAGEGNYWEVCAIDGATGKLTVVNAIRGIKPASLGGLTSGEPGQGIKAASDGEIKPTRFLWDFGDQMSSEEENPLKIYTAAGVYDVSLQVWLEDERTAIHLKPGFITVIAAPVITQQPQSQTVTQGATVTFHVAATGTPPLTYQWQWQGGNLAGAQSTNLILSNVQFTNAGDYVVIVSNAAGSVTSQVAVLSVTTPQLAPSITRQPQSQTVIQGTNVNFTVEASGSNPLSYQWMKDGTTLTGRTNAILNLVNVQPVDGGNYTVIASNPAGAATSQVARLTVNIPGMVVVRSGTFLMGSPDSEQDRYSNEGPQTTVTISKSFWINKYEVTQAEYQSVMSTNPSQFKGDANRPVDGVTWYEATNYCGKLTAREWAAGRLPAGYVYRLPTEAEWEYACRAGTTTRFSYGDDPGYSQLGQYAWYRSSGLTTYPVGTKRPNPWGLYDTHGNVWEWCSDWYGIYPGGRVTDPKGPNSGSNRVNRGGCWDYNGMYCRSAMRGSGSPGDRYNSLIGFRLVLAPGQ